MSVSLHLLVPPSEGKAPGGRGRTVVDAFGSDLGTHRSAVLEALRSRMTRISRARAEKLLGARGALLDSSLAAMEALMDGDTPLMPAWRRYTGVVWGHLEPTTLTDAQRRRLLIPSSIYGITTGVDSIADYRLKMSVGLVGVGNLATYWREPVTDVLEKAAHGRVVVDLLPKEHSRAVDLDRLRSSVEVVRVRFISANGSRAVGHAAKAVKGRLARVILEEGLDQITAFEWEGWRVRWAGSDLAVIAPAAL